jgi:ATP-dependent Clp protease ATP-binding subunit ClpA
MMFTRLIDKSRRSVEAAFEEARALGHDSLGDEDLLLGILHAGDGIAAEALSSLGVTLEGVREESERMTSGALASVGISLERIRREAGDTFELRLPEDRKIPFSPRAKNVLVGAREEMPRRRARAAGDIAKRGRDGRQDTGAYGPLRRDAGGAAVRGTQAGGRLAV